MYCIDYRSLQCFKMNLETKNYEKQKTYDTKIEL